MASRLEKNDFELETVLVLQGGGSLGAYECGVYKALARYVKKFDIVTGTSIGAINANNNRNYPRRKSLTQA